MRLCLFLHLELPSPIMYKLLLISSLMFLFSCKAGKKPVATPEQPVSSMPAATIMIQQEKTGCRGYCPVYTITIHGDGKATYEGQRNMDKIGKFEKTFPLTEVEALAKAFDAANFFAFEDHYTDDKVADLPFTYLTYAKGDQTKKITAQYMTPEELKALHALVEAMANTEGWKKVE